MIDRALGVWEDYGGYVLAAFALAVYLWWAVAFVSRSRWNYAALVGALPILVPCAAIIVWAFWPRQLPPGAVEGPGLVGIYGLLVALPVLLVALAVDGIRWMARQRRG